MKNLKEKPTNSIKTRQLREKFYKSLSKQRKMIANPTKDLKILDTLKLGFQNDLEFELSETDRIALDKHNSFMYDESSKHINTVQSDIRLQSAIARSSNEENS